MTKTKSMPRFTNVGQMLDHLGGITPERIRLDPAPGTATEEDLLRVMACEDILCELIDGVLVEKIMGWREGSLGGRLLYFIECYLETNDIGTTAGADAPSRYLPGLVRLPDVSFVCWAKLPDRCYPDEPIPDLVPDLAVEVLSDRNTPAEMSQKRRDYFAAGVEVVWIVDPHNRTVTVYTSPEDKVVLRESDTLEGGDVLPGFRLPVARIFERVRRSSSTPAPKSRSRRKKPE